MLRGLVAVVLGSAVALAACGTSTEPIDSAPVAAGSSKPAAASPTASAATITKCGVGSLNAVDVQGTLKNSTNVLSDFNVRYELIDASGTRFDDGGTIVLKVAPGQTVKWTGTTLGDAAQRPAQFSCRMLDVQSWGSR